MTRGTRSATRASVYGMALVLGLAACQHRQVSGTGSGDESDARLGFATLYQGDDSHFIRTVRELVRDSTRWHAVWDSAYRRVSATPPPEVNFDRHMLILAASPRGGGGDSVVIGPVRESRKILHVGVTTYHHCHPPDISTHPVHIVRIRRSERRPVFDNKVVWGFNCVH